MESTKSSDVTYQLGGDYNGIGFIALLHSFFTIPHNVEQKTIRLSYFDFRMDIFVVQQTKEVTISADTTCQHIRLGAMLSQVHAQFTTSFCVIYFRHTPNFKYRLHDFTTSDINFLIAFEIKGQVRLSLLASQASHYLEYKLVKNIWLSLKYSKRIQNVKTK